MNRDETIALFERCEAMRAAKKAALAEGKSEDEARNIAHEVREGDLERLGRAAAD